MKPNIIVFMTDQQRGDTLLSESPVKTPNYDEFMKSAVTFKNAFCPAPHCCPSRATFFSGLYPSEHGVWNNVNVGNALSHDMFEGVRLFPEDLKNAGYDCFFSGKWHVSDERGPEDFGFEVLHSREKYKKRENAPSLRDWNPYLQGTPVDTENDARGEARIIRPGYPRYTQYGVNENPFGDNETVAAACEKIKTMNKTNPFFMFVGTLGPHDPYYAPQEFLDLYDINDIELPANFYDEMIDKPNLYRRVKSRYDQLSEREHRESLKNYYAFCSYEDALFGRLLKTLDGEGLADNTIIIYVSDHGDYMGAHGLWAKGLPCFWEAYNVCAAIGGGAVKNPGRVEDDFITLADFAPTILELAGVAHDDVFAGNTLTPYVYDEAKKNPQAEVYAQSNGNEVYGIQRAVWNKKWKFVMNLFDFDELYDLEYDPHEMKNLLHGVRDVTNCEQSGVVREMCKKIWRFGYDHMDNIANGYIFTALAAYGPGIVFE